VKDGGSSSSSSKEIAEILRSLSIQDEDDQTRAALTRLAEQGALEQKQTPTSLNELADDLLKRGTDPDGG
jgi:DNA-binding transcriptional regulator PaaX